MEKLNHIYQGWKNLVFRDPEVEKIAEVRLKICAECPQMSTYPNEVQMTSFCKDCGCVLEAKARSPKANCPLKFWKK